MQKHFKHKLLNFFCTILLAEQGFTNFGTHQNHLGRLLKHNTETQSFRCRKSRLGPKN